MGRPVFDVFPDNPEDPSADGVANPRRSLETVVASGRTDTMTLQRYDIPTGEEGVFAEWYWSPVNAPVLDDEGRVTHIIHRVQGVTESVRRRRVGREQQRAVADAQMRAEGMEIGLFVRAREIREGNEQLSRANAELDAAGRRLREERRARGRFIATLSHELRTPLAAATAATERLALDMPEGRPAPAGLERQLGTLARMSNDLLDGTRAVTRRLELVREPVDVHSIVEGACADIRGPPPTRAPLSTYGCPPRPSWWTVTGCGSRRGYGPGPTASGFGSSRGPGFSRGTDSALSRAAGFDAHL